MDRVSFASLIPGSVSSLMAACLLASCSDPYDDRPLKPAGYYGVLQILEEQATGCLYTANTKTSSEPKPLRRPDGTQMGCRTATPAASQAQTGREAEGEVTP